MEPLKPTLEGDVNLLKDASDLDDQHWRKRIRLGVVTAIGGGVGLDEVQVLFDGQASGAEQWFKANADIAFAADDRVLLIDTNGKGGYVVQMRF